MPGERLYLKSLLFSILRVSVSSFAFPTIQDSSAVCRPFWSVNPLGTRRPSLSSAYMVQQRLSCLRLLRQLTCWPLTLALDKVGRSRLARIAIIAMTTSNSMSVNPAFLASLAFLRFMAARVQRTQDCQHAYFAQLSV